MPSHLTIKDRVRETIVNVIGCNADLVIDSATIVDDLGGDSLDAVEICMGIEEEFSIQIPDEDAYRNGSSTTVGQIIKYLEDRDDVQ
jgi:acyl carrier protein